MPPVYNSDGAKISGVRTFQNEKNKLNRLRKNFGTKLIAQITPDDLLAYKRKRFAEDVGIVATNRDFETMRAMFRKAVRRKWLNESPFSVGENIIEKSLESRRTLTLNPSQEDLILEEAKKSKRSRIYYLLLALFDTGARPSEIYPVNEPRENSEIVYEPIWWRNFFTNNQEMLRLVSYKGKKRLERFVPLPERLKTGLLELWESLIDHLFEQCRTQPKYSIDYLDSGNRKLIIKDH